MTDIHRHLSGVEASGHPAVLIVGLPVEDLLASLSALPAAGEGTTLPSLRIVGPVAGSAADSASATMTVAEAARHLGISRSHAYDLVRAGDLPHLRLGRRIVVPRRDLDRWMAGPDRAGQGRAGQDGAGPDRTPRYRTGRPGA